MRHLHPEVMHEVPVQPVQASQPPAVNQNGIIIIDHAKDRSPIIPSWQRRKDHTYIIMRGQPKDSPGYMDPPPPMPIHHPPFYPPPPPPPHPPNPSYPYPPPHARPYPPQPNHFGYPNYADSYHHTTSEVTPTSTGPEERSFSGDQQASAAESMSVEASEESETQSDAYEKEEDEEEEEEEDSATTPKPSYRSDPHPMSRMGYPAPDPSKMMVELMNMMMGGGGSYPKGGSGMPPPMYPKKTNFMPPPPTRMPSPFPSGEKTPCPMEKMNQMMMMQMMMMMKMQEHSANEQQDAKFDRMKYEMMNVMKTMCSKANTCKCPQCKCPDCNCPSCSPTGNLSGPPSSSSYGPSSPSQGSSPPVYPPHPSSSDMMSSPPSPSGYGMGGMYGTSMSPMMEYDVGPGPGKDIYPTSRFSSTPLSPPNGMPHIFDPPSHGMTQVGGDGRVKKVTHVIKTFIAPQSQHRGSRMQDMRTGMRKSMAHESYADSIQVQVVKPDGSTVTKTAG